MKVKIMKRLKEKAVLAIKEQRGFTLLEVVAAVALLGIFGVVFLSAISTSAITMATARENANLNNLARAQLEYTKKCNYKFYDYGALSADPSDDIPPDYARVDDPANPDAIIVPSGYCIGVAAVALNSESEIDDGVQEITVTITRGGENLLVVKGYKANR